MSSSRFLSTSQAAKYLDLSREHVRRLIQRGELQAAESVNGFMLDVNEVEQYAMRRQVLQDQRQFRTAVDDLAAQARQVSEASGIRSAIAAVRDEMKLRSAFELSDVVAPQVEWMKQQVAAQEKFAALAKSAEALAEQWRRYDDDVRRVTENIAAVQAGYNVRAMDTSLAKVQEQITEVASVAKITDAMSAIALKAQEQLTQPMNAVLAISQESAAIQAFAHGQDEIKAMQDAGQMKIDTLGARAVEKELRQREEQLATTQQLAALADQATLAHVKQMMKAVPDVTTAYDLNRQIGQVSYDTKAAIGQVAVDAASRIAEINPAILGTGVTGSASQQMVNAQYVALKRDEEQLARINAAIISPSASNEKMARGFALAESHDARLEQKVDELSHKVEQLTEVVMQQRAETKTEAPTWQQWAGSDRPEDVLAKLDAVREEVMGEKETPENSTDIIRAARDARGAGA